MCRSSEAPWCDVEVEPGQPAQQEAGEVAELVAFGEGEPVEASRQLLEGDLALEPGQCGTEAEVDPLAECEVVTEVLAIGIEAVRLVVQLLVTIRRREHDH